MKDDHGDAGPQGNVREVCRFYTCRGGRVPEQRENGENEQGGEVCRVF
jgi:hypothetical protein